MQTRPIQENGVEQTSRFYHLFLQEDLIGGWTLVRETGRLGASGKVTKEHFTTWDEALEKMISLRDKQIARGFQVVFLQGQSSPGP